jgi:hypothetical protein
MMIARLSGVGTPPLMLALAVAAMFTVLMPRILAENVGTWAVWTTWIPFAPFVPAQLADAAAHDGV